MFSNGVSPYFSSFIPSLLITQLCYMDKKVRNVYVKLKIWNGDKRFDMQNGEAKKKKEKRNLSKRMGRSPVSETLMF